MEKIVIKPKVFGFICTTAHPEGCAREIRRQIEIAEASSVKRGGRMLVLGSSMGYGLAARITGAFGLGMDTLGVAFERPPKNKRSGSAGWYNTAAFHQEARAKGLKAETIMGDAFSREVLEDVVAMLRAWGPIDYLVYSLAAPRRTDPETGDVYTSSLKAIGSKVTTKMLDTRTGDVSEGIYEVATEEEIAHTVKVMGGEDLERWTERLLEEGLLAPEAKVMAFSYIGPDVTRPIYRDGTIGQAKLHLEATCDHLNQRMIESVGGWCHTVVAKSVVTQSSSAIPGISMYISLVFDVMKEKGLHEDTIEQMIRLFAEHAGEGKTPTLDERNRIRIDDWEMREEVQAEVKRRWELIREDNAADFCDVHAYHKDFLRLFGFGVAGVNYDEAVDPDPHM